MPFLAECRFLLMPCVAHGSLTNLGFGGNGCVSEVEPYRMKVKALEKQ